MEFKGQSNNAASAGTPPPSAAPRFAGTNGGGMGTMNMGGSNKKMILVAIIAALIIVIGGLGWWMMKQNGSNGSIKGGQYQAIFLANGQVYFGKLSSADDKYVKLENIYYLQVQQAVQPADNKATQQPQVSLAKLGSELHGPEDMMQINRDQVLFWENLKDDSKVVKAIHDNQK